MTVLCLTVLYCGSVMLNRFVLWQCYAYVFCIVSVMRTCFVLWQCYAHLFCIVAVGREKKSEMH